MDIYFDKNVNYSFILMFAIAFTILIVFINITFLIIISLINNYKRKQFIFIQNNGTHFEGTILTAYKSCKFGYHNWLWEDSGEISVSVNNKTYTITDIDYNKDFRLLKQHLDDNFYSNKQNYIDLYENLKKSDIFDTVHIKEITVEIYILENKVVADLDSIKIK